MLAQGRFQSLAQCPGAFRQRVMRRVKERWKLFLRPIQHILRKQSASWPEFQNLDTVRRSQRAPHLIELPGHQASEDRVYVARGVEVSGLAKLLGVARVVTEVRIVKAHLHIPRKRNGATLADFPFNFLTQGHKPSR